MLDLFLGLSEAEHDTGLGRETTALGVLQDRTRAIVAGLHAHRALEAFDGFEVVVENIGLGVEDDVDLLKLADEVGDQHLDGALRILVPHGPNGRGPHARAAVLEVVAGDGSDHAMAQAHFKDAVGHTGGLAQVMLGGPAVLDRAEIAGARADVAQDHHRGRAAGPALADVRALRALADGAASPARGAAEHSVCQSAQCPNIGECWSAAGDGDDPRQHLHALLQFLRDPDRTAHRA